MHRTHNGSLVKSRLPVAHNANLVQNQVRRQGAGFIQTVNAFLAIEDQRKRKVILGFDIPKPRFGQTTVKADSNSPCELQILKKVFDGRSLRPCAAPSSTSCPEKGQQHDLASQLAQIHTLVVDAFH